jgi:hypothetical protein
MKKYLLILFVPLAFWACSKKDDAVIVPELATPLVGVYNASYNRVDTIGAKSTTVMLVSEDALPYTYPDGSVYSQAFTVRRDSASVIYVTVTEKLTGTGGGSRTTVVGQLKLRGATPPYDLLSTSTTLLPVIVYNTNRVNIAPGTKIGVSDGTNFSLDYTLQFVTGGKLHEVYTARK